MPCSGLNLPAGPEPYLKRLEADLTAGLAALAEAVQAGAVAVGKGTRNRWLDHERCADPVNFLKNSFIEQTTRLLGEVPKIKVRENLTEGEAFALEIALIKATGRDPPGRFAS